MGPLMLNLTISVVCSNFESLSYLFLYSLCLNWKQLMYIRMCFYFYGLSSLTVRKLGLWLRKCSLHWLIFPKQYLPFISLFFFFFSFSFGGGGGKGGYGCWICVANYTSIRLSSFQFWSLIGISSNFLPKLLWETLYETYLLT